MTMQDPSSPLFVQVAETLKTRILNHEYGPGDSIPSAKELGAAFKVSNITIRRAIEQLAREGYIVPRRGMRAQVAERADDLVEIAITGDFRTWIDSAVGKNLGITAKIIDREPLICPKPICDILELVPGEKIEKIRRIRKRRGTPISYYVTYGPLRLLSQLSNRDIERKTFVDTFQSVCKVRLKSMEQRVRAAKADMDLAEILQVEFGFPLFLVQNVYRSNKDIPMAVTHIYYRSDHYVYTTTRRL